MAGQVEAAQEPLEVITLKLALLVVEMVVLAEAAQYLQ